MTRDCYYFSYHKYIQDLLKKAGTTTKGMPTPTATTPKLIKGGSEKFAFRKLYRSIVSSLQYATIIRPEISYAVNHVLQFNCEQYSFRSSLG